MAQTPNTAPDIDVQLERLVDTRGYSYDDARRELGVSAPDFVSPSASKAHAQDSITENPKDFSLGEWRDLPQSQRDINKAGAQAVRAALAANKIQRGQ